jgi:hypothetical protein
MPSLDDLIVVSPAVTKFENSPVWEKLRSVEIYQNSKVKLRLNFLTNDGRNVDFSGITGLSLPKLRLFEVTGLDRRMLIEVEGTAIDESKGLVEFDLTGKTNQPGIYYGNYFRTDSSGNPVVVTPMYISIIPSLLNVDTSGPLMIGPISSKELQLAIRGSSPVESTLLMAIEFDLSEIVQALRWPVEFWNTSAPDIGVYYHTGNFPYKYQWVEAAIGELLILGAHRYRRDHLPNKVEGGLALDDLNKFAPYDQAGWQRRQVYQRFVRNRKVTLDIAGGYGSVRGVMTRF